MRLLVNALLITLLPCSACLFAADPPSDLNPEITIANNGVKLTLIAEHPDVVTPTGLVLDST